MDVHSTHVCANGDHATSAPSADANRAHGDNNGDTTTVEVLAWGLPALSLALERVFEFYLADEIDLRLRGKTSVVARVETARWVSRCGLLHGSPEFCAAARRAIRMMSLVYKRVGDMCVHKWAGLAGLDRSPDDARGGTRGSVTLIVGGAASGKTYASSRLCPAMSQAMARASCRHGAPCNTHGYMVVGPHTGRPLDEGIARHLLLSPHARVALVHAKWHDDTEDAEVLCARGFHVIVDTPPVIHAHEVRSAIDRVIVALGPRGTHCRQDALSASVAAIVDADPAALNALFAVAPDYAYLWFEPVDGRFGAGRTVVTLSRASDFETADGSAPPFDPRQVL